MTVTPDEKDPKCAEDAGIRGRYVQLHGERRGAGPVHRADFSLRERHQGRAAARRAHHPCKRRSCQMTARRAFPILAVAVLSEGLPGRRSDKPPPPARRRGRQPRANRGPLRQRASDPTRHAIAQGRDGPAGKHGHSRCGRRRHQGRRRHGRGTAGAHWKSAKARLPTTTRPWRVPITSSRACRSTARPVTCSRNAPARST